MEIRENIEKYTEEVNEHDDGSRYVIKDIEKIDNETLKVLITYTTMMNCVSNNDGMEIMDIAKEVIEELKKSELDFNISSNFINSIFNFDNVYIPLYDLLELSTEAKYGGKKRNNDYRDGIIDSIVSLRKFERSYGLGDHKWDIPFNTIADNFK
jgi:hypothetical protein